MLKIFSIFVLAIAIIPIGVLAQNNTVAKKAPIIMVEQTSNSTYVRTTNNDPKPFNPAAVTWVSVDTMSNTYGPAISVLNPIAYDPGADVVALLHRGWALPDGYAFGSGELWYNLSMDGGVTWDRITSINTGLTEARYPSMAIINETGGAISGTIGLFAWPNLTPAAFGNVGYGADAPLGGGSAFWVEVLPPPTYSSQVPCWAGGSYGFWASDNGDDASYRIWRTADFGTIDVVDLPSTDFTDGGNIGLGGAYHNGMNYLGFLGTFADPNPDPINFGWYPGYYTSADDGVTWDGPTVVDFRTIPALADYDQLFDYIVGDAFVSFAGDINVDKDGYVHMTFTVTDTLLTSEEGDNALVEIFNTATGWDAKIISTDIPTLFWTMGFDDPGLGQMGPSGYIAFNEDRDVLASVWNGPATPTDTIADVFISYRTLGGDWSTPENLTNTPNMNEDGCHLAPQIMAGTGTDEWVAFPGYFYELGNTTPVPNLVNPTEFFVGMYNFTAGATGVDDQGVTVNSYDLQQNYPNPFNPSTSISYSISENSKVQLRVYDVLGNEVATLVNEEKSAGSYNITFNASNLASGLYLYKLTAGNFTSTKKMMLLK